MKISKHHYALELARRGNTVYFIEPPSLEYSSVTIIPSIDHERIHIVRYKPVYRGKRFLPAFIFRRMLKKQVKILLKKIGAVPQLTWCFEPYRFENLEWFGEGISIFHAMDLFSYQQLPPEVFSADICLGVSDTIVKELSSSGKKIFFINHGLSGVFAEQAEKSMTSLSNVSINRKNKVVGYSGNLLMQAMDRSVMKDVISKHPDLKFIFWGQFEHGKGGLIGHKDQETDDFIAFLKSAPQVELRGPVSSAQLAEEMKQVDLFWICWKTGVTKTWDGSNSHKLLEYLSYGKPIVSHFVSTYAGRDLFYMLPGSNNQHYPELFDQVLHSIDEEPTELRKKRIAFALDNTYCLQVSRIESIINATTL